MRRQGLFAILDCSRPAGKLEWTNDACKAEMVLAMQTKVDLTASCSTRLASNRDKVLLAIGSAAETWPQVDPVVDRDRCRKQRVTTRVFSQ